MGSRRDPWAALLERLRGAAASGFAGVGEDELGAALRGLVDACRERGSDGEIDRYRKALEAFEGLDRQGRSVLVARGLRLCATPRTGGGPPRASTPRREEAPAAEEGDPWPHVGVETLPGVGRATASKLQARGLRTVVDLAYVLPNGYEDRRHPKTLGELAEGEVAVLEASVGSLRQGFARGRFMATMELRVGVGEGTETVLARWFHRMPGLERWPRGGRVIAIGAVKRWNGQLTMAHPELHDPDAPGPAIAARYPAVEGIAPRTLAKTIHAAVARLAQPDSGFVDTLPRAIAEAAQLPSQLDALRLLHHPPEDAAPELVGELASATSVAHRRLAFDEFFFFQLALLCDRGQAQAQPARVRPTASAFDRETLRACLPFEPTAAQWRALGELADDMRRGPPMLRLLQGDVGSGKTAVAFGAVLAIARSGAQAALMAPTEILAEQHHRTFSPWCERAGLRLALLTGATPRAQRTSMLALLGAGKLDLLVGTHALLTEDVRFAELGLVVIDEQHRFGVEQRAVLRRKGELPHLLVMTATPIPRTTALCAYGELEVSVIDELPPGRTPPKTFLFHGDGGLAKVRRGIADRVKAGFKVFVVCPLVEASEALEVTDVEATAAELRAAMPDRRIDVVHGRMSGKDKDAIMSAFRRGELDVLVATTVIEVGVDIPDARVMVVEHAERFGLAQLHQLRGRIGRGGGESWCLLHTASRSGSDVSSRLGILTETHDGFVVAERDLALRGPGEVFGTRQAGAPRLRFAGFAGEGTKLLVAARAAAERLLAEDPGLARHPELRAELQRRRMGEVVLAADSG